MNDDRRGPPPNPSPSSERDEETPATASVAIREAAFEMERPIFVAMVIIIAAYLPLFGLERVEFRVAGVGHRLRPRRVPSRRVRKLLHKLGLRARLIRKCPSDRATATRWRSL